MAKKNQQQKRRQQKQPSRGQARMNEGAQVTEDVAFFLSQAQGKRARDPIEALSEAQGHYMLSIDDNDVTFGLGPAGSGKTFVATSLGCDALMAQEVEKFYVVRPMVESEDIGYLPGDVDDKFRPYFRPVYDVMEERLGKAFTDYLIKLGKIEVAPLAFLRGRTLKNAFVILDEAQNTTPKQMRMFLTRLGENVQVVINGDETQVDIDGPSGLPDAFQKFSRAEGFGYVWFEAADVRRSALAQRVVEGYSDVV